MTNQFDIYYLDEEAPIYPDHPSMLGRGPKTTQAIAKYRQEVDSIENSKLSPKQKDKAISKLISQYFGDNQYFKNFDPKYDVSPDVDSLGTLRQEGDD